MKTLKIFSKIVNIDFFPYISTYVCHLKISFLLNETIFIKRKSKTSKGNDELFLKFQQNVYFN